MQLSSFTDYTLRVLMHLAVAQGQKLTTRQIAEAHGAKFNHLAKVTQWLVREGYVTSTRGRTGGLRLLKDPSSITVGQVVRALESQDGLVECMRNHGSGCVLAPMCELKSSLHEAEEAFFKALDHKTLASLTEKGMKMNLFIKQLNMV